MHKIKKQGLFLLLGQGESLFFCFYFFEKKQKIAIIRQVVQDGQVMIFDEPTSAMDESGKKQFLQLIDQIKNHKIIIIVSHDNAILNTCDEILIL